MTTEATPTPTTPESSAAPITPAPVVTPNTPAVPDSSSTPPANTQAAPPAETPAAKAPEPDGKVSTGDKPGDKPATPAKVVPDKYDLKLSTDSLGDQLLVDKIADYSKSQGLSQQEAAELLSTHEQAIVLETKERSDQWLKEAQSDPTIGGEKLKEASENTRRALKAFDPSGRMTKLVDSHGYGNHPAFIEFGNNVGKMLQSHGFILGTPGADAPKSHAEILYGGSGSKA